MRESMKLQNGACVMGPRFRGDERWLVMRVNPMNPDFNEIAAALQRYYDGLYHCDAELLMSVFHPGAHYHTASGGEHLHYDMPAYRRVIAGRTSPAQSGEAYGYEIESIRFAGGDTALAILKCEMMGKRFTDFLSFIRDKGEWRIIAKVFHYDLIREGK
jgi:hypothetical protein